MDSGTTLTFIVVFGTVGICCTLVVLKTWVLRRQLAPAAGGWAMISGCLLVLTLLVAADGSAEHEEREYRTRGFITADHRAAEQARIDKLHKWIGPALERYRSERGVYPPTIEAAGIRTPMTRYGPLYYYSSGSKREPWYLLSFGDIERLGFSADWDSRTQKWTMVEVHF